MAEDHILKYLEDQNRPFSVQLLSDNLAHVGIKKGQVQRALDSLSENGKITCKEFGKVRMFLAIQKDVQQMTTEESDAKKQVLKNLEEEVKHKSESVRLLSKELKDLQSTLTEEEIDAEISRLAAQLETSSEKLAVLENGTVLVTPEERAKVELNLQRMLEVWGKRKRMFRNIWDTAGENIDQSTAAVFEEAGIETDEEAKVDFSAISSLLHKDKKARRF